MAVILACFAVLFFQLNRIQVFDVADLRQHPVNTRTVQRDFGRERGLIVTADGVVVAKSVPSDGSFEQLREYPEGELYAHSAGYLSFTVGAEGLERSQADALAGRSPAVQLGGLSDWFGNRQVTGEVVMTLRHDLQTVARSELGSRRGSVVVMDPRSGEVLALWSYPSFDPNPLASDNGSEANAAFAALNDEEGNPLRAAAFREVYFPGSTFKVVTMSAALSSGVATLTFPVFDVVREYLPPLTSRPLGNFGGSACGGDLVELLRVSCNTGFARLGAEYVGPSRMIGHAQDYGFNQVPPFDLPGTVASRFPTDFGAEREPPTAEIPAGVYEDSAALAQASIGQNDVAATPLQMALVAAAVANGGRVMEPHVVQEIRNLRGDPVERVEARQWREATDAEVAEALRASMVNVVTGGTARSAAVDGIEVGAKTGTAQLGDGSDATHAWMVAFAGKPGDKSELAIAVHVEAADSAGEQTGGRVAGPIVRALVDAYFNG